MKEIYIPSIGDKLRLVGSWSFTLQAERRNLQLAKCVEAISQSAKRYNWECRRSGQSHFQMPDWGIVTLPVDTVLTVDRIYIRKGLNEFDSVSFIINKTTCSDERIAKSGPMVRFWVKLEEFNGLCFEPVEEEVKNESAVQ